MRKNSKSAKPSVKKTSETSTDVKDYFQLGNYVKFIDMLGHDHEGWGIDLIEFKILKGHLGDTGQIIDMHTDPAVPAAYNLFLTVQFKDGFIVHDASFYSFGPPDSRVYDFQAEKKRREETHQNEG